MPWMTSTTKSQKSLSKRSKLKPTSRRKELIKLKGNRKRWLRRRSPQKKRPRKSHLQLRMSYLKEGSFSHLFNLCKIIRIWSLQKLNLTELISKKNLSRKIKSLKSKMSSPIRVKICNRSLKKFLLLRRTQSLMLPILPKFRKGAPL